MTVQEIIDLKLEVLRSEECVCITTLMDDGNNMVKCDICKEIEMWEEKCTCDECEECLNLKIQALQSQPCECTYKTIVEQHPSVDEDGNDVMIDVEVSVIDVMCARCVEIKEYQDILDKWEILSKANIDKADFDKYDVVNGVICSKVVEGGNPSEIDELKEVMGMEQMMQNFAIDTMMFEIIPDLESRLPQSQSLMMGDDTKNIKIMKGLVKEMGAYFADRIIRGVVTYKQCFSISMYRKYQADTDAILRMEGYGHLIVPIV